MQHRWELLPVCSSSRIQHWFSFRRENTFSILLYFCLHKENWCQVLILMKHEQQQYESYTVLAKLYKTIIILFCFYLFFNLFCIYSISKAFWVGPFINSLNSFSVRSINQTFCASLEVSPIAVIIKFVFSTLVFIFVLFLIFVLNSVQLQSGFACFSFLFIV